MYISLFEVYRSYLSDSFALVIVSDLASPIVRRKTMSDHLEHPPLIFRSDCCFLQSLSQLVSVFSLE